jgi:hypothetical protein
MTYTRERTPTLDESHRFPLWGTAALPERLTMRMAVRREIWVMVRLRL